MTEQARAKQELAELIERAARKLKDLERSLAAMEKKRDAMPDLLIDRLRTMRQVADQYPHLFSYDSMRRRVSTGELGDAVVRLGRRVWIDLEKLSTLLEKGRVTGRTFPPSSWRS